MQQPSEDTKPTSVTLSLEHDGLKVSVSVTGADARKDAEELLDKLLDYVDDDDDDEEDD